MKTPVVYKIADNLRCLLAEDGQKISIGSAAECDVQINGDAVHDVETTVQFVNDCQSVRILSSNGGAPHEQSLPWTIPLAGFDLVFYRPFSPVDIPEVSIEREITLHGLTDGKIRHVLKAHQPLLLGSSEDCDLVNSSADCPVVQLALWATVDNKVAVEVLDNSSVVDWLGRANATKAEMELPASLSLGGKIICIVNSDESSSTQISAPALTPAGPPALAKAQPPSIIANEFYINKNRQQHGPFLEEEVRRSVHRGTYNANDLAWKEGEEDWVPLNKLISISGPPRILPPLSGGAHNHSTLVGAAGQWVVGGRRLVDAARQWLVRDRRLTPQIMVSTNIVAPETASPRGVIIASWVLIVLLCGGAFIPGLGFGTWALVWPFMLMTFILGIIALARRATVQGLMILLATILLVPAVIFVATVAVGTAQKTVESVPELQQSIEQLGKSIKVVQDLSDNAKIVTDPLKRLSTTDPQESKSADLSKGPQSNVNASTAPRSTDDSSGTMAEQPISNKNQGPELPVLATELPSVFEADGSIKLADNYIIKPLGAGEDAHIKATQVMLRGLLDTYGTKILFSITNKPAQGDITIVLTVNGRGVKEANTLAEAIFKARETKQPLVFQVTSRMGGGIGTQIGPSAIDLILGAAAVDMQIKPENSQTMLAVSSVDLQGGNGLVRTDIEKSHGYMLPIGKSPFQPPNVDRREFISTLLPNIMGDQLVAVGYSEGSFSVNGGRNPQSKRIALHRDLDNVEWYDQWLIGAKARDTNYEWDDSENWTLHPAGGVSNPNYESLLEQTRVASDGIPRNSFVECVVNDVAVMRETDVHIASVTEANGKIWFAPLALFSPSQQRYMKKEYWRLMPNCSSLRSALAKNDLFAKICANEYRFVDHNILQEAAAKGDPDALNVLGRCYLEGLCYGDLLEKTGEGNNPHIVRWLPRRVDVPKDALKAVELLKAAAEKGNIDACIALGEYLSKQADQEHLGRLYYLIAAYVGHPLAHLNLALEYRNMKNAISNVTDEQRARRTVWHLLCAVNCNREFMSLRVGGETVRVMCYDLAGDMLDSLEDSLLREYAKIEMQKLKMPWPMKWDRTAADNATGILASAEELQHEIDNYLKSGASSSNGGADLSKGPQSNVNASTAPRSTDDSSGTMVEQPISNKNQGPELPVNASNQMPVVEKNNKTIEQQVLEDFQREANKLAESLRKDAAKRPTILQTYLEDAPKISFSTRQPELQSNEICAIAHVDGFTPRLFFGDEFYSVDSEVRDPNFRIGAAAKSPLGSLINRVGNVMGFDRMEDIPKVLGNLMLHSPGIADQNIRTEALKKSEVFRGVIIGDDALSVITQIFKSNSFIYDKTFRLLGSQISYAQNSIVINTTTKVFDEYCSAAFIFVPPNEFEDADFVKNISSLKSYRLVGLEINLMGQDEAQRVFNEYFKKAMYGKTEMVWTTSDRELLKSLGLGAFLEKQDMQSLNQAAETIKDVMKYVNAMNAERNRSDAFIDQFKVSAQSKYDSFELNFKDISWQYTKNSGIIYYCKNKIPQMVFSVDYVSDDHFFSKDRIILVTAKDSLRFYHNALLIQNDASSVMRGCIDYLQSKIDEDERKLKNTRNGDFK